MTIYRNLLIAIIELEAIYLEDCCVDKHIFLIFLSIFLGKTTSVKQSYSHYTKGHTDYQEMLI